MIPPLPNLDEYQISAENGFLPAEIPLGRLTDPYYGCWEDIAADLQNLIANKTIRSVVDELPILSPFRLQGDDEWRRAYVVLGFISNAYIWGLEQPKDRLPPPISIPFLAVSARLEVPPVVTYATVCLWNFAPISPYRPIDEVENLVSHTKFTSTVDEQWFYLVSVAIEARGAPTIPLMLEAMDAARKNDTDTVIECLTIFASRILDLRDLLARMYDNCTPSAFYFKIRPFLAGSKNMAEAGLPNGVLFEDGSGKEQWRQYAGGSNAQSSLIQFFDIALGIQHRPTGIKKDLPSSGHAPSRHNFIEEMRSYMPGPHRRFLEHLSSVANIREFVESGSENPQLAGAYDGCLRALAAFRDQHLQIVSRYIVIMAQASNRKALLTEKKEPKMNFLGLAKDEASKKGLKGTGGTRLMPFLKQSRDETLEPAIGTGKTEIEIPGVHNPASDYTVRSCKVNDLEDIPVGRTGVGMAANWDWGDYGDGGICNH